MALLLTLRDGGARLVSTGNLNTTQPDAVLRLRSEGVTVVGGPTKGSQLHATYLEEVLAAEPDLILDNGGDLFARYLDRPYDGLVGGTEETTSGRMRLEPLREAVARRRVDAASCVVPVPRPVDEAVARAYLDLKYPAEE
ncbi:MAG TPA: hypothetical protein VFW50_20090 [Streptosporangiaceae bacterium]|nr:hypothetical protein [Streptosporangiaceae bacterium]